MIQKQDILNLSALARLHVSESEVEGLAQRLNSIIEYIGKINAVSGSIYSEKDYALAKNIMRADENPHESELHTKDILAVAPKTKDNFIQVKKILNG